MKALKQKNEEYSKFSHSFETLLEKLLYNPHNRKFWSKQIGEGNFRRDIKGLQPILEIIAKGKLSDFDLSFIGQSHLDAAWLWPQKDTKIRAYKTFYQAVKHLKQYPFFTFSQTSPQYYQWIKAYDPKLFEEVKKLVQEGRFEPTGGMWIEPTLDECWGEALVRQRLYGQLWFLREFGFYPKVESLLDVFGFPYSLPQILVKSGAEAFWTTKCTWNDTNKWPIANFIWKGIDGSEIFTHQFKFNVMALIDLGLYKKMARLPAETAQHQSLSSHNSNAEIEAVMSEEYTRDLGIFYGFGDGARGPLNIEIALFQAMAELGLGKFTTTQQYFDKLKKSVGENMVVWDDEMYLEYHRGCKTTQVEIKHYNRRAELWAEVAETMAALTALITSGSKDYPKAEIFEIWRRVLFNQFHDILPGSSIPDVYLLAVKEQKEAAQDAERLVRDLFAKIALKESEVLVFNPFSWARSEYLVSAGKLYYAKNIPPLSIQKLVLNKEYIVEVDPTKTNTIIDAQDHFTLENRYIKATILKNTGTLVSLYYKPLQSELLTISGTKDGLGSGLRIYKEHPKMYPAWNIDANYWKHPIKYANKEPAQIAELDANIPAVSTTYHFLNSSATVSWYLLPDDIELRLHIHTDLQDAKVLIKYFLPISIPEGKTATEIPYATMVKDIAPKSEMEKAKWERPMQKWVDIFGADYGVAILNNNRYGYSISKKGIYITLTRSPKYPTPGFYSTYRLIAPEEMPKYTDLKEFNYDFSILPHPKDWKENQIWQKGYALNFPLILLDKQMLAENHPSSQFSFSSTKLSEINGHSLVEIDNPNVILGSLKLPERIKMEGSDSLVSNKDWKWDKKHFIIRLIEQAGDSALTKITFNSILKIKSVWETDLLEQKVSEGKNIAVKSNSIAIEFHKFEIKTYLIELA